MRFLERYAAIAAAVVMAVLMLQVHTVQAASAEAHDTVQTADAEAADSHTLLIWLIVIVCVAAVASGVVITVKRKEK